MGFSWPLAAHSLRPAPRERLRAEAIYTVESLLMAMPHLVSQRMVNTAIKENADKIYNGTFVVRYPAVPLNMTNNNIFRSMNTSIKSNRTLNK